MTDIDREQVLVAEHRSLTLRCESPSDADLQLARRLAEQQMLTVRWLADQRVEIVSNSWVGVVRFSNLDVLVEPKLVGDNLRVLRMLEYAAGIDLARELHVDRPLPADGSDLFELVCMLLAREVNRLLLDGVLRDYRIVDDTLTVLRGRLRPREQYLRRFGRVDQLECRFDEYDCDIADNQFVTAALAVAARRAKDPDLRWSLAGFHSTMSSLCEPPNSSAAHYRRTITYTRRNDRYRHVHELAGIVLDGLAFDDLFDVSTGRVSAFMLNMNKVFEAFISRLVRDALAPTGLRVSMQKALSAVIAREQGGTYTTVRPDLVIEDPSTGRMISLDAKYKTYQDKKVQASDIYQTFLYAYALARTEHDRRSGILFPSTSPSSERLTISAPGAPASARIIVHGIDVPRALDALGGPDPEMYLDEVRTLLLDVWRASEPTGTSLLVA